MANLWENSNEEGWVRTEVLAATCLSDAAAELLDHDDSCVHQSGVLLYPSRSSNGSHTWLLLAPCASGASVNDTSIQTGVRVLADRDAIRLPGPRTLYFSMERLARIEPFPDLENIFCPRCKLAITPGDDAVCCPQCGIWHHEQASEEQNCWSYSEKCSLCDQSTDIAGAEFRWTPERL